MPIFGKRKKAQLAEERRQETLRRNQQEAQDIFSRGILGWLDRVSHARTDTGCAVLTDAIVDASGPIPPYLTDSLNEAQRIMMRAYAQSLAAASVDRLRTSAVVAAARARDTGTGSESAIGDVISYWESVNTYLEAVLR